MGLCHGCGLFDDSSVRFSELLCGSAESLDCGDLAGMEGFHASKEASFRISSSAHFQLHQRLCPAGNVPPYLGSPTVIFSHIPQKCTDTTLSWHATYLQVLIPHSEIRTPQLSTLASFRNLHSTFRITKALP